MSAEESPSCLLRQRLTLSSSWNALFKVLLFSFFGEFLFFAFHAAMGCVETRSALMAIAQMKPNSSRQNAVITFL